MQSITITKEEFELAVREVNENFDKREDGTTIGEDNPMATMMMKLQNIMFAGLLGNKLFGNEEDK